MHPLRLITALGHLEHFVDRDLAPGTVCHQRVDAEDWSGHRQTETPVAASTTPQHSP